MTSDVAFKDWVVHESRYPRFVNEIQYYAGKLRNDAALVDLVGARHANIMERVLADLGDVDLHLFETLQMPSQSDTERGTDLDDLFEAMASPPLSKEEKDAELEGQFPRDEEGRQEVFRPRVDDLSDELMLSLLLYSGMIKNMELIEDGDKRRHLGRVWQGWSVLLWAALRVAPRLAKERRIRINGAMYEVQAPFGMSDGVLLRKLMLLLPHVHVRMLSGTIGTEKLERQLTEPTLEEAGEPKIYDFLRTGLIADLQLTATPYAVSALASRLKDNRYLLGSLIVHLSELRRLDRVREDHFRALEEPLATSIANLKGGPHKVRANEKRRQLARLERDRLLLSMKRERRPVKLEMLDQTPDD
jgi:hypothetical protein